MILNVKHHDKTKTIIIPLMVVYISVRFWLSNKGGSLLTHLASS